MVALFDANTLVNLLLKEGGVGLRKVFANRILDLTIYEVGNSLWKLSFLQDKITPREAREAASLLEDSKNHFDILPVTQLDLDEIIDVAAEHEITFYDASYLVGAKEENLKLVTEDEKLAEIAEELSVLSKDAR